MQNLPVFELDFYYMEKPANHPQAFEGLVLLENDLSGQQPNFVRRMGRALREQLQLLKKNPDMNSPQQRESFN